MYFELKKTSEVILDTYENVVLANKLWSLKTICKTEIHVTAKGKGWQQKYILKILFIFK